MEYVIAAYTIIFLVLIGYVLSLLRRQRALRREIEALRRLSDRQPRRADNSDLGDRSPSRG